MEPTTTLSEAELDGLHTSWRAASQDHHGRHGDIPAISDWSWRATPAQG